MGLNSDSLSDEVCQEKAACLCSFKYSDSAPSFKISEFNNGHHANSETSYIVSVCSSHDSSTDNAESKAVVREYDASEGILMLSKLAVNRATAEDQGLLGPKVLCDNRTFSNEHETPKASEYNGDDMSCISEDHKCVTDRRNVSCSPSSVNSSLVGGPEKKFGVQLTSYIQASSHYEGEEGHNCSCMPVKPTEESTQETALSSGKSYPSEVSSFRDIYTNTRPLKGDLSECSRVQEEPLGTNTYAMDVTEPGKPKTEVDEEDPAILVKKHFDKNEDMVSLEVPNGQRPPEQSQIVKCRDKSDDLVDVKVCDICGDAGREHLLATCSKCSDGAEHTYCMCVMLEKVPEGNWMCEDCKLQEETEKQKKIYFQKGDENQVREKFQEVVRTPEVSSSNQICQNAGNSRNRLELDIRSPNAEKSGRVHSIPRTCAKRPAGNAESESIPKRRALETSVGSPRMSSPCRKTLVSRDSPHKKLYNMKVKPTCQESTLGDYSNNESQRNVRSPTISASNSPKTQMGVVMSRGFFTKSNSFNLSDSKVKVDASSEVFEKKQFSRGTASGDKGKHGIVKRMSRTLSFDISNDHSNAADPKITMLSPSMSFGKDSKRHTHAKEHNLSQRNFKAKLDGPMVSSPMGGKQVGSDGETVFPCSSGAKCYPKPVPSPGNCDISSKPACLLAHGSSKHLNNDQAGSNVVKKQKPHSCLSKVVGDPSSLTKSYSLSGLKPNVATSKDHFRLNASTASRRYHAYSSGQDILPQSQASCNQDGKSQKTSYFSSSREHIAAGNGGGYPHKFNNIIEAAESCPITSHQASIHERGSSKETTQSSNEVYGPKPCNQTDTFSILAIPELNYIWKGGFKIQSVGRLPNFPTFCPGIQAHLSACASPKVSEVVRKFPCKVLLEEVSRLSAWPSQFQENHPNEGGVGVYFFAEDIVSYEGNYGSLIKCMIDYDLALKGNIDGTDLLIFSSNLLPEKSQRWNKLFFLWGVFRGRRISNEEYMHSNKEKASLPGLNNNVCSDQALSIPSISGIQNMCAPEQSRECFPVSKLFNNSLQSSGSIYSQELPSVSPGRKDKNCGHQPSSDEHKYSHLQVKIDQRLNTNDAITCYLPMQNQVCRDAQQSLTPMKEDGPSKGRLEDYQPNLQTGNPTLDYTIESSGSSHSMMAINNSRATCRSPFSADPGQADGKKLKFKHYLEEQVLSSDRKDCAESDFLDLDLSLWPGMKPKKQVLLPNFQWVADEDNQFNDPPNSTAGHKNDDGGDDKLSASVELSLTLPPYGKMKMPPNSKSFEL